MIFELILLKKIEITNYSITDIAFDAGYSSPSLFIKTFKKITSLTPNSYRKIYTALKKQTNSLLSVRN